MSVSENKRDVFSVAYRIAVISSALIMAYVTYRALNDDGGLLVPSYKIRSLEDFLYTYVPLGLVTFLAPIYWHRDSLAAWRIPRSVVFEIVCILITLYSIFQFWSISTM